MSPSAPSSRPPTPAARDTNTPSPVPAVSSPRPKAPSQRPVPGQHPPRRFIFPPVYPHPDLVRFAHVFSAFKRRAALDILSERMSSGQGSRRNPGQGSSSGRPGQMGMQAFPGYAQAGPSSSHAHHQQPRQSSSSSGHSQDGLGLLADVMTSSPPYGVPSSSSSPVAPQPQGYPASASQLAYGWPGSPSLYGYSQQDLAAFQAASGLQQQHPGSSTVQQPNPLLPDWQSALSQSSLFPLAQEPFGFPPSAPVSPQELQANLQAQMMYLQWQQQQLQAAMNAASSPSPPSPQSALPTSPEGANREGGPSPTSEDNEGIEDKRRRNTEASGELLLCLGIWT